MHHVWSKRSLVDRSVCVGKGGIGQRDVIVARQICHQYYITAVGAYNRTHVVVDLLKADLSEHPFHHLIILLLRGKRAAVKVVAHVCAGIFRICRLGSGGELTVESGALVELCALQFHVGKSVARRTAQFGGDCVDAFRLTARRRAGSYHKRVARTRQQELTVADTDVRHQRAGRCLEVGKTLGEHVHHEVAGKFAAQLVDCVDIAVGKIVMLEIDLHERSHLLGVGLHGSYDSVVVGHLDLCGGHIECRTLHVGP